MIIFENLGEIDFRSISHFGINVKPGKSPIGFFGTGLKYAIAVLMRTGQKVTIYSGLSKCTIGTEESEFRGKNFNFIKATVDDNPSYDIGFTTELGKMWPLWAAYRELAVIVLMKMAIR